MLVSHKKIIIEFLMKETCQMKKKKIVEGILSVFSIFFPLLMEHAPNMTP
jgi:hypothetical protein